MKVNTKRMKTLLCQKFFFQKIQKAKIKSKMPKEIFMLRSRIKDGGLILGPLPYCQEVELNFDNK
jgi:hypothetical protein